MARMTWLQVERGEASGIHCQKGLGTSGRCERSEVVASKRTGIVAARVMRGRRARWCWWRRRAKSDDGSVVEVLERTRRRRDESDASGKT